MSRDKYLNRIMKTKYCVPAIVFIVVLASVFLLYNDNVAELYTTGMRSSLFTGLFTLSGFLLSAKTFVVLNMKKEVYSTDNYLRFVMDHMKSVGDWPIREGSSPIYEPLRITGNLLTCNVLLSLTASVCQFTLGLYKSPYTISICLAIAASAIASLAYSFLYIALNLHSMYQHFEDEARARLNTFEQAAKEKKSE